MAGEGALEYSDMTVTLWNRAQVVFSLALDRKPEDRALFVAQACGADTALREEVESLLAHDIGLPGDSGQDRLEGMFQFAAAALMDEGSLLGRRVGAYRIEAELGHGGMGTVYLAVRADDEFQKKVAIKVVKWGMDTRAMLERFRYERQILASLDHPNIARLMDGGTTEDRQPYFVMEYVEGRAIDRYCLEAELGIPEICRLFLRVCEAVAYAHRNLVVHRDLKPGNIIVTADGAPKLLDFGVAKLLGVDAAGEEAVTNIFHRPLTPEYASPEQVRGLAVSTATDVYSLGAVLYELLTGARLHSVVSNTASEWERAVCETEVPRPSLKRQDLSGDLDNILLMALRKEPERRYSSVEQLAGDVRRYLDGRPIVARQDSFRYRAGKYIRRNRAGIAAAGLVAVSLLVGTLLALTEARDARAERGVAEHERALAEERSRQAEASRRVSDREHEIAEQERAKADLQAGLAQLAQHRAEQRLGQMVDLANTTLQDIHTAIERLPGATEARREIVVATLKYLENLGKDAGNDPNLRAVLAAAYYRVGEVQGSPNRPSLGDTGAALKRLDKALEWARPLIEVKHPEVVALRMWVHIQILQIEILEANGKSEEVVRLATALLPRAAQLRALYPSDGSESTLHQFLLTSLTATRPAEAMEHARLAVQGYERLMALDAKDYETILALSAVHSSWGAAQRPVDPAGAFGHFRESVRLREELVRDQPENVAARRSLMLAYAQTASMLADFPQLATGNEKEGARAWYEKATAIGRALAKADPMNQLAQYDLASGEMRLAGLPPEPGKENESLAQLREARGIFEKLVAADPKAIRSLNSIVMATELIGNRLKDTGHPAEALAEYKRALEVSERTLTALPGDVRTKGQALDAELDIASLLAAQGDSKGAFDYAGRAVARAEILAKTTPTPSTRIRQADAYAKVAAVQCKLGNWAEARATAMKGVAEWRALVSARPNDPHAKDLAAAEKLLAECDAHLK
jgi:tetratricopeptide (TPR) repeat protein